MHIHVPEQNEENKEHSLATINVCKHIFDAKPILGRITMLMMMVECTKDEKTNRGRVKKKKTSLMIELAKSRHTQYAVKPTQNKKKLNWNVVMQKQKHKTNSIILISCFMRLVKANNVPPFARAHSVPSFMKFWLHSFIHSLISSCHRRLSQQHACTA